MYINSWPGKVRVTEMGAYIWEEDKNKSIPWGRPKTRCMHDACSECHGTGRRRDGTACIHMISCPCERCNPYTY